MSDVLLLSFLFLSLQVWYGNDVCQAKVTHVMFFFLLCQFLLYCFVTFVWVLYIVVFFVCLLAKVRYIVSFALAPTQIASSLYMFVFNMTTSVNCLHHKKTKGNIKQHSDGIHI